MHVFFAGGYVSAYLLYFLLLLGLRLSSSVVVPCVILSLSEVFEPEVITVCL